jgi:hypothetical protein
VIFFCFINLYCCYKTQMGTTLSSCSHFVACELLHLRRQATVIVAGCIFIFFMLTHDVVFSATHRFLIPLFKVSSSSCPFGFPCGQPSRTECFTNTTTVHLSRSEALLYETFKALQPLCSPGKLEDLRLLYSPIFYSTF